MSAISIHWAGLAKVAEVSLAFGVGIVAVFALGVLGLSRVESARAGTGAAGGSATARVTGYLTATVAFLACAAAVGYGLYLLIPQFHN
jgi:hypothetical protein